MKPNNIYLIRHGQSIGNVDKKVYATIPDYALPLTELGHQQADEAGKTFQTLIGSEFVQVYGSPFWRSRETFIEFSKYLQITGYYEDPRLREQDWGQTMESREDYDEKIEEYRDHYGHFYYRFLEGGEACVDVFDRMSLFMDTLWRDFQKDQFPGHVIINTHGMTLRLFIMRWFHCTVEEFETWGNPRNCQIYHMKLNSKTEKYELLTPMRTHKLRHNFQFNWGDHSNFGTRKVPVIN